MPVTRPKAVLGGRDKVKVCIAQISPVYLDRDQSTQRACAAIREAAANGADLVVFPEVWLSGYPYWTEGWDSNLRSWVEGRVRFFDAAVLVPSDTTEAIGRAARAANIHVVMGCNEMDPRPEVNTIYNTLLFFDRNGDLLGRHRKLMPTFSERSFWGQGNADDLVVFDTDIGRLGGLICGEHLMIQVRASMIAMGEDIHVAVFPGAFTLHGGPCLEEWDTEGHFWGHSLVRAHSLEGGCFTLSACGVINEQDIADDFPHKTTMNMKYARGGSSIINPLGVPLVEPVEGEHLIYAECHAWMIKAFKAICDTLGHYSRPDATRLMVRRDDAWTPLGTPYSSGAVPAVSKGALARAADYYEIDEQSVAGIAETIQLRIEN